MEKPHFEVEGVTEVEKQKEVAKKSIIERINTLMSNEGMSQLAAAKKAYEEVKGEKYREEQALALLLTWLEKQNEADMLYSETSRRYPGLIDSITDQRKGEEKFLVHTS